MDFREQIGEFGTQAQETCDRAIDYCGTVILNNTAHDDTPGWTENDIFGFSDGEVASDFFEDQQPVQATENHEFSEDLCVNVTSSCLKGVNGLTYFTASPDPNGKAVYIEFGVKTESMLSVVGDLVHAVIEGVDQKSRGGVQLEEVEIDASTLVTYEQLMHDQEVQDPDEEYLITIYDGRYHNPDFALFFVSARDRVVNDH